MGKTKSFVDKFAKGDKSSSLHCPKCGELISEIKLVKSEYSKKTESWRFRTKLVDMCSCNKKEITN